MKQKYREILETVRSFICDYEKYIPYVSNKELEEVFSNIQLVLYGMLTQHPDNDYAEEDWENAEEAVSSLCKILEENKTTCN